MKSIVIYELTLGNKKIYRLAMLMLKIKLYNGVSCYNRYTKYRYKDINFNHISIYFFPRTINHYLTIVLSKIIW